MDLEHYDEFGNYIGPELPDSDSEESVAEETSEMPLVPTGVIEEGTDEVEEDESMQGKQFRRHEPRSPKTEVFADIIFSCVTRGQKVLSIS